MAVQGPARKQHNWAMRVVGCITIVLALGVAPGKPLVAPEDAVQYPTSITGHIAINVHSHTSTRFDTDTFRMQAAIDYIARPIKACPMQTDPGSLPVVCQYPIVLVRGGLSEEDRRTHYGGVSDLKCTRWTWPTNR